MSETSGDAITLSADDITIDESGRVVITNERVAALAKGKKPPKPTLEPANGNCQGATCNTVAGCGAKATQ